MSIRAVGALWLAAIAGACSSSPSASKSGVDEAGASSSGSVTGSGSGSTSGSTTASSSGASSSSSGSSTGSSSGAESDGPSGDGSLFNPTEVARVAGWLSNTNSGLLSWVYTNIDMYFPVGPARDKLVDSIVGACAAFAPRLPNWQEYCEAIETSEIVSESSFNPAAQAGAADDPTVGLLQVGFSASVHDFNYYGPLATIEAIGCNWPAALTTQADVSTFWNTQGGSAANIAFMEDPACNIPLSAYSVYMSASGNGGATAVYAQGYCAGNGVAGNVVDGLLSYVDGPSYPRPADPTNAYPAGIKARFVSLLGGLPSPDPFGVTLSPDVAEYCR